MSEGPEISLRERIRINLVSAMEKANINQVQLGEKLGVSKGTVNNWTRGNNSPDVDMVPRICKILGITIASLYAPTKFEKPDDLPRQVPDRKCSKEAFQIAQDYDVLDAHGKKMVRMVTDEEKARCIALKAKRERARSQTEEASEIGAESALYYFPTYDSPMSAGTGLLAGQEYPKLTPLVKEPPRGASYIAPVSGDSMEPTYSDGDLLFIHATPEIEVGQVGVFLLQGQQRVQ